MADIPAWVPVLTAATSIVSVTIPLVIDAIRGERRDKRIIEERLAREQQRDTRRLREECARLLGAGHDFKVLVENDLEYNGPEKAERGWQIRDQASEINKLADAIGMLVPGLEQAADALSAAAAALVPKMTSDQGRRFGGSATDRPEFGEYDGCLREFKAAALTELAQQPPPPDGPPASRRRRWRQRPETASPPPPAQLPLLSPPGELACDLEMRPRQGWIGGVNREPGPFP